ncbi:Gonadotropin-releasing hormone receptor [Strongyloides ratti]|uniref:Gonadotropin-releasing hormone receptor n=1 Tax=Strongyloides ratti TaxID=34506 RepID=A0A090MVK5_STRRB|nr:Gonadotropin-releasing hormone receptor [Strongyloides ratti]CEF62963.1 Gonadotropin-releasing hormone receptor [Strongyloides ratti]
MNNSSTIKIFPLLSNETESNTANNVTDDSTIFTTIEMSIYFLSFVIGGPLNIISFYKIYNVFCNTKNCTQIILLRLNLNIADLITVFIFAPGQFFWLYFYQWYAGDIMCRIFKFFAVFCFYLNSFIIACIAVDRLFSMTNIHSIKMNQLAKKRAIKMIIFAWIVSFILALPQLFIFQLFKPFEGTSDFKQCTPIWTIISFKVDNILNDKNVNEEMRNLALEKFSTSKYWEKMYNIFHLLFTFWIPTIIIIISYVLVLFIMGSFTSSAPKKENESSDEISLSSSIEISAFDKLSKTNTSIKCDDCNYQENQMKILLQNEDGPLILDEIDKTGTSLIKKSEEITSFNKGHTKHSSQKNKKEFLRMSITPNIINKENKLGTMAIKTIEIAKKRTKKQAMFIIIAFLTIWTPYNLLAIMNFTFSHIQVLEKILTSPFITCLNALLVINPIINPIIYGIFDGKQ